MKRRALPRYGKRPTLLTAQRVHLIRTSGMTDGYWAKLFRVTPGAVRAARIGKTWPDHPTPPDVRPRRPVGRCSDGIARHPEPAAVRASINQALRGWRLPVNPTAEHP